MSRVPIANLLATTFAVTAAGFLVAGCVRPLDSCFIEGSPDVISDQFVCPDPCYEDFDEDGYGDGYGFDGLIELGPNETCPEDAVTVPGDCDDDDPNAFPGNREVCDGMDNDCNGSADFDVEGEEEQGSEGSFVFSCTPPDVSIQIFLLGGTEVAGQPVNATTSDIQVSPGQEISSRIWLRTIVPRGHEGQIAGGVSHSWATEHQGSFTHMWRTDAGPDLQPGPGITDWEFTPDVVHAPQEAPGVDSNNAHYITMGAMLSPHPEFIGSLTHHRYCVEGEEGPAACAPVWDGIEGLPGGEEDEGPDRDLADMDELDLAGCHSFGAARLSVLIDARRGAESCEIDDGDPQPCIPFYRPISLGCAFLKIVVEDSEGGDR